MTFTNERSALSSLRFFGICVAFLLIFYPGLAQTGTTWTSRTSAADNAWIGLAYGNNLFVAVASNGTGNRVMTSPDGITWTARNAAAENVWAAITYANGLFVAVGTGNATEPRSVMTSPDGITWTIRSPSNTTTQWTAITYGNGLFVATGPTGTVRCMTSPDGINWTDRPSLDATQSWTGVAYGNGKFVAVSGTVPSTGAVSTSTDGITWTSNAPAEVGWQAITYGNNTFVAVRNQGTGNRAMTSTDGATWTVRTTPYDNAWRAVGYGGGLFVATSISSVVANTRVMTSPDGITWTSRTSAAENQWRAVAYGNGTWVATATSGVGNRVMTSGSIAAPVTWQSFTATAAGNSNDLHWKTATESNNAHFDIERSGDGVVFVKIGQVAAADNATNGAAYSFTDRSPLAGKNYYRIKQVDQDARFEFSKTVSVEGAGTVLFSIFPNPVRDVLTVKGLASNKTLNYTITNIEGRVVLSGPLPATQSLPLQSLVQGKYVLRIGERSVPFVKL